MTCDPIHVETSITAIKTFSEHKAGNYKACKLAPEVLKHLESKDGKLAGERMQHWKNVKKMLLEAKTLVDVSQTENKPSEHQLLSAQSTLTTDDLVITKTFKEECDAALEIVKKEVSELRLPVNDKYFCSSLVGVLWKHHDPLHDANKATKQLLTASTVERQDTDNREQFYAGMKKTLKDAAIELSERISSDSKADKIIAMIGRFTTISSSPDKVCTVIFFSQLVEVIGKIATQENDGNTRRILDAVSLYASVHSDLPAYR